jgi:hypothetical protein
MPIVTERAPEDDSAIVQDLKASITVCGVLVRPENELPDLHRILQMLTGTGRCRIICRKLCRNNGRRQQRHYHQNRHKNLPRTSQTAQPSKHEPTRNCHHNNTFSRFAPAFRLV